MMNIENNVQEIEIELSSKMIEELATRAATMGLTAAEYATCVMGQHLTAEEVLELV
jgi:hypothetical protein